MSNKEVRRVTVVKDPVLAMSRFELKYLLDPDQEACLRRELAGRMCPDRFGVTTIQSLYYDTPDDILITRSLEGTGFKEKMRLRSYGPATDSSPVFLELKRKCGGTVYKRRLSTTVALAQAFFRREATIGDGGQISREISFFRDLYGDLQPKHLILCEREAFFEPDGDLRLTLDANPRYRTCDLDLRAPLEGKPLLPAGHVILELKVQRAVPLWLSSILDRAGIRKTSFSKVGAAYKKEMETMTQRRIYSCLIPSLPIRSQLVSSF